MQPTYTLTGTSYMVLPNIVAAPKRIWPQLPPLLHLHVHAVSVVHVPCLCQTAHGHTDLPLSLRIWIFLTLSRPSFYL